VAREKTPMATQAESSRATIDPYVVAASSRSSNA
jgi:hypothetical protein